MLADELREITEGKIKQFLDERPAPEKFAEKIIQELPEKLKEAALSGRTRLTLLMEPSVEPRDRILIVPGGRDMSDLLKLLDGPYAEAKREIINHARDNGLSVLLKGTEGCLQCGGYDDSCVYCYGRQLIGYSWESNGWSKFGIIQFRW